MFLPSGITSLPFKSPLKQVSEEEVTTELSRCHQTLAIISNRFQQHALLAEPLRQLKANVLTWDDCIHFPKNLVGILLRLPLLQQIEVEQSALFPNPSLAKLFSDCIDAQAIQKLSQNNKEEKNQLKARLSARQRGQVEATYINLLSHGFNEEASIYVDKYYKRFAGPYTTLSKLPLFCLEQGNVEEAARLCSYGDSKDVDRPFCAALDHYFKPLNEAEIEKVGMTTLLRFVSFMQDAAWKRNYQLDATVYFLEKRAYTLAWNSLQSTGKPPANGLNKILMQKAGDRPQLLGLIRSFAEQIGDPIQREACLNVCRDRVVPPADVQSSAPQRPKRTRGDSPG